MLILTFEVIHRAIDHYYTHIFIVHFFFYFKGAVHNDLNSLPFGRYILVTWDGFVQNGSLLQVGFFEIMSRISTIFTLLPEDGLTPYLTNIDENRLKYSQGVDQTWLVFDPKQQNLTHLMSFEEALEKVLDRFNQILNNLPEYDGIVLLCHEEESMTYFLKAVKKSGLYERFSSLVKGLGYVCQYLSGK